MKRELVVSTLAAPGDMVEISVTDTGTRILPEISTQLFQPFTTTKREGIGVGLSISRTIVEAHGGSIAPRSKSGRRDGVQLHLDCRKQAGGCRCRLKKEDRSYHR